MEIKPSILVSSVYLKQFDKERSRYDFRDWVMDSGAFSAHQSGTKIDLMQYIDICKQRLELDKQLTEVFALDVIGDWKASLRNTEIMWEHGVPAIPCYHAGEPESILIGLSKDYPKIALGGVAKKMSSVKLKWAEQCFARVWPCKIHGFGFSQESALARLPFHSVDATTWEISPCRFGRWVSYGNLSVRGGSQNLRVEVEHYLRVEHRARLRWKKEMALLGVIPDENGMMPNPIIRLAYGGPPDALAKGLGPVRI